MALSSHYREGTEAVLIGCITIIGDKLKKFLVWKNLTLTSSRILSEASSESLLLWVLSLLSFSTDRNTSRMIGRTSASSLLKMQRRIRTRVRQNWLLVVPVNKLTHLRDQSIVNKAICVFEMERYRDLHVQSNLLPTKSSEKWSTYPMRHI